MVNVALDFAGYGLGDDLYEIVPKTIDELKKLKIAGRLNYQWRFSD
jgi:hypothetical protein